MKKVLIWGGVSIFILFATFLILKLDRTPSDVPLGIENLPALNILLTDSVTVVNTANAKSKQAVVIFFFDPNCEHCQVETEEIMRHKDDLKQIQFYFISLDSLHRIRKFMEYYKLKENPVITVGKDYKYSAINVFKIPSLPTNIVYNKKHKIVKIFPGGINYETLRDVLNL